MSFFKDTMAGASGVDITARNANTGGAWAAVGSDTYNGYRGVVTTGSNSVRPSIVATVAVVRSPYVPPSADYEVRFRLVIASLMGAAQVLFRLDASATIDVANYYGLQYNATTSPPQWECQHAVNGAGAAIGTPVVATYGVGTIQDMRVTVAGTTTVTITLYNAGAQIAQLVETSGTLTPAGTFGLLMYYDQAPGDVVGVQFGMIEAPSEATSFAMTGLAVSVPIGGQISGTITPNGPVGQAETVTVHDDQGNTLQALNFVIGATAGQAFSSSASGGQVGSRTITATPSPPLGTAPTGSLSVTSSTVPTLTYSSSFDFGAGYAGQLAGAGYTLIARANQSVMQARTATGVAISATDGTVSCISIQADPTTPFDVRWDTGGSAPVYGIDPYPMAQNPIVNANTVTVNGQPVKAFDDMAQGYRTSGGVSIIKLGASASPTDGFYNDRLLEVVGGTGVNQFGYVVSYVGGTTREATLNVQLATVLDTTSEYSLTVPQPVGRHTKYALDTLDITVPPGGVATNFRQMMIMVFRRWCRRVDVSTSGLMSWYQDDNQTVLTTQSVPAPPQNQSQTSL